VKLGEYKLIFVAIGLIGILLIASPVIANVIPPLGSEQFSELYLLGPNKMAENYPYNIAVGQDYSVFVNVGNHLGSAAYYVLYVKFGNQTDQLPNATLRTPSPLQSLFEYRFSIPDGKNWTSLLTFSVSNATILTTNSQIKTLKINEAPLIVEKPAVWNSNNTAFAYRLFFELWLYNEHTGTVEFNNRFVSLQLNLTRTS
jgi:hypothetical protein